MENVTAVVGSNGGPPISLSWSWVPTLWLEKRIWKYEQTSKNFLTQQAIPIGCIFTDIWVVLGVNVGKYTIHWACGIGHANLSFAKLWVHDVFFLFIFSCPGLEPMTLGENCKHEFVGFTWPVGVGSVGRRKMRVKNTDEFRTLFEEIPLEVLEFPFPK